MRAGLAGWFCVSLLGGALSSCAGPGSPTPADAVSRAADAVRHAASLKVTYQAGSDKGPLTQETIAYTVGDVEVDQGRDKVRRVKGVTYVFGSPAWGLVQHVPVAAQAAMPKSGWVISHLPEGLDARQASLNGLAGLIEQFGQQAPQWKTASTLTGSIASQDNASALTLDAAGKPVSLDLRDNVQYEQVDFSAWNQVTPLAPPAGAVDLCQAPQAIVVAFPGCTPKQATTRGAATVSLSGGLQLQPTRVQATCQFPGGRVTTDAIALSGGESIVVSFSNTQIAVSELTPRKRIWLDDLGPQLFPLVPPYHAVFADNLAQGDGTPPVKVVVDPFDCPGP